MDAKLLAIQPESHDPIIQDFHSVRENLVEKYQGI
jgi:hypothetical protein